MSLEIHVYGPGFGETIFLRWPREAGGWHGAVVDGHSPGGGEWLAEKLAALGMTELDLVVATHPHLDHIFNLATGLALAGIHPRSLCYWPGPSAAYWVQFFDGLAAQNGGELGTTAAMVRQWFGYADQQRTEHDAHAYDVGGRATPDALWHGRCKAGASGSPRSALG